MDENEVPEDVAPESGSGENEDVAEVKEESYSDTLNADDDDEGNEGDDVKIIDKDNSEEEEEEKEEELEEEKIEARGTLNVKSIQKAYPDLFKKFPDLRHVLYRDKEMVNLYPTVEDAKEAHAKSEFLDELSSSLAGGNPRGLIAALDNDKLLAPFSEQFLPTLFQKDKELFVKAVSPVITDALRNAYREGSNSKDENLANAARIINKFIFGSYDIQQQTKKEDPELTKKQQELEQRERNFFEQRRNEFTEDLGQSTAMELEKLVSSGIDPERKMTNAMKRAAVAEVIEIIGSELQNDPQHMAIMKAHLRRAERSGFQGNHKAQLINAYLGRAKNRYKAVCAKVRADFLGSGDVRKPVRVDKQIPTNAPGKGGNSSTKDNKKMSYSSFLKS